MHLDLSVIPMKLGMTVLARDACLCGDDDPKRSTGYFVV